MHVIPLLPDKVETKHELFYVRNNIAQDRKKETNWVIGKDNES